MCSAKGFALALFAATAVLLAAFFATLASGGEAPAPAATDAGKPAENPAPPAVKTSVKTTELGLSNNLSKQPRFTLTVSPDGRRYASTVTASDKDTTYTVIVDGKEGKAFSKVTPVIFSPDSKHFTYTGTTMEGQTFLITDNVETAIAGTVDMEAFSPDGKRIVYFITKGDKHYVFVDGQKGKEYDGYAFTKTMRATPDSEPSLIVWPGTQLPFFSPDSKRYAYIAQTGGKWRMVVDGEEGKAYDDIEYFPQFADTVFSPDSKHTFYQAGTNGKAVLVIDGKEIEGGVMAPAFSADGKHTAYAVKKDEKTYVVVLDEKPGKEYNLLARPVFSPDSKHMSYLAESGKDWFVVTDGVEGKKYSGIWPSGGTIYSPDSQHIAFGASRDKGGPMLAVDEVEYDSPYVPAPDTTIFSPDSKHTACLAVSGIKDELGVLDYFVLKDGVKSNAYMAFSWGGRPMTIYQPVFSADSKHLAYCTIKRDDKGKSVGMFVVDGTEVETGMEPWCAPIFDSPTKFH